MQEHPKGVTVLSVLALVGGILSFVAGLILMFGGGIGTAAGLSEGWTVMALGGAMFAVGLVSFVVGYGFWTMRRWAASAALAVYGASLVINVMSVVFAGADPVSVVLPMVVAVAVIWYVQQPETRAALTY